MKNHTAQWEAQYARLRDRFQDLGWISEGYVQDRGRGPGGPVINGPAKYAAKP